ncbi:septum formation family protein [Micromonospora musae]|uniref:septum formation family protein n=1 Tax=Micromonospora musae TaxID=1894970 RepID=UPI0013155723|nr:septum formation family protein [Micromonospora musae]
MDEAVLTGLREVAGPELYRRNAFRVTGLPVDVDRPTARRRQQRLAAALKVGADVDGLGSSVSPEQLRGAFDVLLGDPRRRLVHEVFGTWGAPNGCECPSTTHAEHDRAVQAHAEVLDMAAADVLALAMDGRVDDRWAAAAAAWTKTLRSATFWRHLHHRVERLDDRQLDASVVESLRAELPGVLVAPLLQLAATADYPAPLRKSLADWPVPERDRDRLIEEAAGPQYEKLETIMGELHRLLESGDIEGTVARVHAEALPALARLEGLAPVDRHRRTSTARNRIAVALNNCAVAKQGKVGRYEGDVQTWLDEAESLATDPETVRRIDENREGFLGEERAIQEFRARVYLLQRTHGRYAALQFLRNILSQSDDEAMTTVVRGMLAELNAGEFSYRPAQRAAYERQGRRRRVLGAVAVCALLLVIYVLYQVFDDPDGQGVDVHGRSISDNPPVVACVADGGDWRDGDAAVSLVDCSQEHWAEVVAYVPLAVEAEEYPGTEEVSRLARFLCAEKLAQFSLPAQTYDPEVIYPGQSDWEASDPEANYATCAARRSNETRWNGQATAASSRNVEVPAMLPLTSHQGSFSNPPAGTCLAAPQPLAKWDEKMPVVRCDQPHWAQILGYPPVTGPWSDESEVRAEADAACSSLANSQPSDKYTVTAAWPPWWNGRGAPPPDYVVCLGHRVDDQLFSEWFWQ